MVTALKARRRKNQSMRSPKGKKKPKPDLIKRRKFLLRNLQALREKPLRIVFFGSVFTRSGMMKQKFQEFLAKKGFRNNFVLIDQSLFLEGYPSSFARFKSLMNADIIAADPELIKSLKEKFSKATDSLNNKLIVKVNEFNPSEKEFEALFEKGLNKLIKRNHN